MKRLPKGIKLDYMQSQNPDDKDKILKINQRNIFNSIKAILFCAKDALEIVRRR